MARSHLVLRELSFAFGDRVHFLCLSKENRTKRKDTPRSRPLRGFVSRSRGFRQFFHELTKTRVRPCTRPFGPDRRQLTATEGTRKASQVADLLLLGPVGAPSSAGIRWGKARMFERMDARVRAGHRIPSNAGNGDSFIVAARTPGAFSFGYFSFGQAKKSDSAAAKRMSKALAPIKEGRHSNA